MLMSKQWNGVPAALRFLDTLLLAYRAMHIDDIDDTRVAL